MDDLGTRECVTGGCGEPADVFVHWSFSGEADPLCVLHAAVALQLADDAMTLINGTSTQFRMSRGGSR